MASLTKWCYLPLPIGAMPLRVSDFHFPISNFHSLALALVPIGHGNTVVDTFPSSSPSPSPGTSRLRYLSDNRPHGTCHFAFPISIFQFPFSDFHFSTQRRLQARRAPRGIYGLGGWPTVLSMCSCTYKLS